MSSATVTLSAKKIYDKLNLSDTSITSINLHSFYSKLYTAGCSHEEARILMKWRRSAQSRKHPENCERKLKSLETDITRLQRERERLTRERRGLELEIRIMGEALREDNHSE